MTTRSATRSAAKTVDSALPSQASANIAMQNYVKQKTQSAKRQWENCLLKLNMSLLD